MMAVGRDIVAEVTAPGQARPFRIMLHVPGGPAPASGWPVLYMVDGNAVFATTRDALRAQAPHPAGTGIAPGVIAAIGYPVETAYDPVRRSLDLTPPPGRGYPAFPGSDAAVRTGGAESFRDALAATLMPWVAAAAPVDGRRQTLFGHSFGGLFALFTLFTRPSLFDTIVAASPALSWEDGAVRPFEDGFRPSEGSPRRRVLLSAGEWEGDALAPFQRGAPDAAERLAHRRAVRTVAMARDLADRLNARHGGRVAASYETFAGENHMSVLPVAVNRAVQAAFAVAPPR